mgnify:FL=1
MQCHRHNLLARPVQVLQMNSILTKQALKVLVLGFFIEKWVYKFYTFYELTQKKGDARCLTSFSHSFVGMIYDAIIKRHLDSRK